MPWELFSCNLARDFARGRGSANYSPQAESILWPVCVNKVLSEESLARLFIVYGRFCSIMAELNSCDKECVQRTESKIFAT